MKSEVSSLNNELIIKNSSLLLLLLYGVVITGVNLYFTSPYHDEALNILMGHQILAKEACPGCAQNTGSVAVQPILAALGDQVAGIAGSRAIGILFSLSLTVLIYAASSTVIPRTQALFAATMFLFSGPTLYLSTLATYDIVAAFFLGLSLFCILKARSASKHGDNWLFSAAVALFFASITKYVVAVYAPFLLAFVLLGKNRLRSLIAFVIPFLFLVSLYILFALYPVLDTLRGSMLSVYNESQVSGTQLASWAFRWVAMPYLLAVFGMFHESHGKTAVIFTILSTPVILFHLLTGAEQSINKNVIFSLVFLAPAAAIGIDHLGNIFSFNASMNWVKSFFIIVLFLVLWAFGLNQMRWLHGQYPDLAPVVEYFKHHGKDGMTVLLDSDYGDAVYGYTLGKIFPHARFSSMAAYHSSRASAQTVPDYIILDDYYTKKPYRLKALSHIREGGYSLAKTFNLKLSWGEKSVSIYRRRIQ